MSKPHVYFCMLSERTIPLEGHDAFVEIALEAGKRDWTRMRLPYMAVDKARCALVDGFEAKTNRPHDYLVMLDCDHDHPVTLIQRLISHDKPIMAALAFRRGEPFDPVGWRTREGKRQLPGPDMIDAGGIASMDGVGFGAVAIRRDVFTRLRAAGYKQPFFRYTYEEGETFMQARRQTEEIYFCEICRKAGIEIWMDFDAETPHLLASVITRDTYRNFLESQGLMEEISKQEAEDKVRQSAAAVRGNPVSGKVRVPTILTQVGGGK